MARRLATRQRSLFYVPGSQERKLKAAQRIPADTLVFDLEDSVTLEQKPAARSLVAQALQGLQSHTLPGQELAVRMNAVGSGLEIEDLNAILAPSVIGSLSTIVIPKVNSVQDLESVCQRIPSGSKIQVMACIESAIGLVNLCEIASSVKKYPLKGLVFAAEDYCADTGILRTASSTELLYARQKVVATACAFGLEAIDMVCVDYKDPSILRREAQEGREFGFTGKQAIHPTQVSLIQEIFSPSPKEIALAESIINGYKTHKEKGVGAFTLDGKMVDMPVVKWAERLLERRRQGM